jgi:hypothetical protein
MLATKLSNKIGKYLNRNSRAAKVILSGQVNNNADNSNKRHVNKRNKRTLPSSSLRPVNLFHEVGMIIITSPKLNNDTSNVKKKLNIEETNNFDNNRNDKKKNSDKDNSNSNTHEFKYHCNICSADGIYTGRAPRWNIANYMKDAVENPHQSIEFHTWKELDEERLNSVNMIIQRAVPTLQIYDGDGAILQRKKDRATGIFSSTFNRAKKKDPLIPSLTRASRAYDTVYSRHILKFVNANVKRVKNKTNRKSEKHEQHLFDLYEILQENIKIGSKDLLEMYPKIAPRIDGTIAKKKYPFATAHRSNNTREYHLNGDLYDYAAVKRRKAVLKIRQKRKKKIFKHENNIIKTTFDNYDPLIEDLINDEKYESVIGYLLGDGKLVKHKNQRK